MQTGVVTQIGSSVVLSGETYTLMASKNEGEVTNYYLGVVKGSTTAANLNFIAGCIFGGTTSELSSLPADVLKWTVTKVNDQLQKYLASIGQPVSETSTWFDKIEALIEALILKVEDGGLKIG